MQRILIHPPFADPTQPYLSLPTLKGWLRQKRLDARVLDLNVEAIHWLLRAGTAQNRWQELGEYLHRYVTRNPGDLAVRFAFAGVLLRDERIEAARREYETLQMLAPDYDGLEQLGQAIAGKQAVLLTEAAQS